MLARIIISLPLLVGFIVLLVLIDKQPGVSVVVGLSIALISASAAGGAVYAVRTARRHVQWSRDMERELSIRREMEENFFVALATAEQANEAKSNFLANVSHELRTPMTAIVASTDLLLTMADDPRQIEFLKIVRESSSNMTMLINNLLDLARGEMGRLELEESEFDLRGAVSISAAPFAKRAADKGLCISTRVDASAPQILYGDAARLKQVLHNLIDNAVKFSRHGNIRLRVVTAGFETTRGRRVELLFSVSDEGPGIPNDLLGAIFEPFTQADASSTREFGGTGLGLAICQKLVELMGGEISVDSVQGVGTTVSFQVTFGVPEPATEHDPASVT